MTEKLSATSKSAEVSAQPPLWLLSMLQIFNGSPPPYNAQ